MENITFLRAIDGYLLFAEPKLSPNTIKDYLNTFRKFSDYLGCDPLIEDITVNQIEGFISANQHLSKKTLVNYHVGLSALWTWAVQHKVASEHVPGQYTPPRPDHIEIVPFSAQDVKLLVASCSRSKAYTVPGWRETSTSLPNAERMKTIIILLLDTGMRAQELCDLKITDVDLRNRAIIVMGKGRKQRQLPVSARTSQVLWSYLATRPETTLNSPLFATVNDRHMTRDNLLHSLYRLGDRAGVQNVHPHRFRHTFAINFLRNGGDIFTLQRILGHSTLDMVKRYLSIAQVDVQAAHRRASPVTNWGL